MLQQAGDAMHVSVVGAVVLWLGALTDGHCSPAGVVRCLQYNFVKSSVGEDASSQLSESGHTSAPLSSFGRALQALS